MAHAPTDPWPSPITARPVLDCKGRVVAVVTNIFTQKKQFLSNAIRISTAWGQANVASIPIQVLKDVALAK